jgi:hypothetical protein
VPFHPKQTVLKNTIQTINKFKSTYMSTIRSMAADVVPYSSCRYTLQPLKLELRYNIEIKVVIQNNYINLPTSISARNNIQIYCQILNKHQSTNLIFPFGNERASTSCVFKSVLINKNQFSLSSIIGVSLRRCQV